MWCGVGGFISFPWRHLVHMTQFLSGVVCSVSSSSLLSLLPFGLCIAYMQAGLAQLANSFPKYPVTGVPVTGGLHLKSFMSMAGPDLISIGMSQPARKAADIIKSNGKFKYSFVQCPDDIAANCLYVNGHLIHVTKEAFPRSAGVYENLKVEGEKFALDASELNKVDGCFTCCSVLVKKSKQLLM